MLRFAATLAVVMSSAHFASRLVVDKQHDVLGARAKKEQHGALPLGPLRPEPASQKAQLVGLLVTLERTNKGVTVTPKLHWRQLLPPGADRPLALTSWAAVTLAAARAGHLAMKNLWQNSTVNKVSGEITAAAHLDVARSALAKALEEYGDEGFGCLKAYGALRVALDAMDDTQAAFNDAQPVFDSSQRVPDDLLEQMAAKLVKAVEGAMDITQASMDAAQEALNDALRAYDAKMAAGKVFSLFGCRKNGGHSIGIEVNSDWTVANIVKGSPAEGAGIRVNDRIESVDGKTRDPAIGVAKSITEVVDISRNKHVLVVRVQAEMRDKQFQTAITTAIEALEEARSQWWYDVQRMEAVSEEETVRAERVAVSEAEKKDSMAIDASAREALKIARKAKRGESIDQEHATFSEAVNQHYVEAANKQRIQRQAEIWKKTSKVSKEDEKEVEKGRNKSKTFPIPNIRGLWT